ncbi:FAR1-related sequence 10 [Tanacetum coccineum]
MAAEAVTCPAKVRAISRINPSWLQTIEALFPAAEHRFYLRYIHENMKSKWAGTAYKELLWSCATALTIPQFQRRMNALKDFNKDCYDWLCKIPPQPWAISHFLGVEWPTVNGRDKPIISALEYAREYMMKRIVIVKKAIAKCVGPLTPTVTRLFEAIKNEASEYNYDFNGGHLYVVSRPWQDQRVVDILHRICTCRKWELTSMPCKHDVATNWNMDTNNMEVGLLETWCHPCYRLDTWKAAYSHHINPIRGKIMWPESAIPTTIIPPKFHPQIGRPTKKICWRRHSNG